MENSISELPRTHTSKWMPGIFILLLIISAILVYSNTFHNSFVYDDINFITKNDPHVHMTVFSWEKIKEAAFEGQPRHRYLPNISFAINYYFGKENTFGYHLINLAIHLLTGIFLFFFFWLTLGIYFKKNKLSQSEAKPALSVSFAVISFFAVLIWLVHPVQTNGVTYVCQRMASMVAMFYVLAMLFYVKGRLVLLDGKIKTAILFFAGCIISGSCAVASKENAGALPIFILLYEWFFFQDLKDFRSYRALPWIIIGPVVFTGIAIYFLGDDPFQRILNSYTRREFTLPQRVLTEFRVVVYYLSLIAFPFPGRLILDHDYPLSYSVVDPMPTIFCMGLLIGLAALAFYMAKKERLISFCIFWFLGNLMIESSVIGIEIVYEHRLYLPSMFVYLMITIIVFRFLKSRWAALGLLTTIAVLLSLCAHQRNTIWQSDISFWTDSVKKAPNKARPYQNLAYSYQIEKDFSQALVYYQKSINIKPHPVVFFNMGLAYSKEEYYCEAVDAYINALKSNYNTPQIHSNFAIAMSNMGEFQTAITHFKKAAAMNPNDTSAKRNMASLLNFLRKCKNPITCVRHRIQQQPDNAALHFKLGMLYEKQGDRQKAINAYRKILEMVGESDRKVSLLALNRLAVVYSVTGETDRAIEMLKKGIRLTPDNPLFYYQLAGVYAGKNNGEMAIEWLNKAVKKGFNNWEQIKSDKRFDRIRYTPYYRNLKKRF
ncbi:MAG: tetratricopeptide repeat protein [Dissulfuribacterales bacterium]